MSNVQVLTGKFVPSIQPNPDISRVVQQPTAQTGNIRFSEALQSRMQQNRGGSHPIPTHQTYYKPASSFGSMPSAAPMPQAIPIPETLPKQPATPQQMESKIIENLQKYQEMNARQSAQSQAQPMSAASFAAMDQAMRTAQGVGKGAGQGVGQPVSFSVADSQSGQPNRPVQSMNALFARGVDEAGEDVTSMQAGQPVYVPAPEVQLSAEEAAQLDVFVTGQGLSQSSSARQAVKSTSSLEGRERTQESNDSDKKKGFFGALGSFFKNLASGLTLGFYRPDREPAPQGIARVADPLKKIMLDAPKSLLIDAPVGAYHDLKGLRADSEPASAVALNHARQEENARGVIEAGKRTLAGRGVKPLSLSGAPVSERKLG